MLDFLLAISIVSDLSVESLASELFARLRDQVPVKSGVGVFWAASDTATASRKKAAIQGFGTIEPPITRDGITSPGNRLAQDLDDDAGAAGDGGNFDADEIAAHGGDGAGFAGRGGGGVDGGVLRVG